MINIVVYLVVSNLYPPKFIYPPFSPHPPYFPILYLPYLYLCCPYPSPMHGTLHRMHLY